MVIWEQGDNREILIEAVGLLKRANKVAALTGAGISVASGIPDFRSPGGLWSVYAPDEYATLDVFYHNPAKAWDLYRALGRTLVGKTANPAHQALADLENKGVLHGIITQNIDNLHQQAGSRTVLEIHGDHQHLQCLQCSVLEPVCQEHLDSGSVPVCPNCEFPLKPNVVLFGEAVRHLGEIQDLIEECDLLLVIGTSAQVYPAAGLPGIVKRNGGIIFEFNKEQALGGSPYSVVGTMTDYFFRGDVVNTLPELCLALESSS